LAGANTKAFFDFRVFITKYFATVFMMASGFPFGLIATNVHMGAMIAHNLQKIKYFKFTIFILELLMMMLF
jgi:H+/Cl- antiporter ClcA